MREKHPLAGKTVILKSRAGDLDGLSFLIEDWWQNVNPSGKSWKDGEGCAPCFYYSLRTSMYGGPLDDEVIFGEFEGGKVLVHASELGEVVQGVQGYKKRK